MSNWRYTYNDEWTGLDNCVRSHFQEPEPASSVEDLKVNLMYKSNIESDR